MQKSQQKTQGIAEAPQGVPKLFSGQPQRQLFNVQCDHRLILFLVTKL